MSTFRLPRLASVEVSVVPLADGGMILRNPIQLLEYPRHLGHWLRHWADKAPDRTFLAERPARPGHRLSDPPDVPARNAKRSSRRAERPGGRLFERSDDWRRVSFAAAARAANAIAGSLLARGLGPQRPLAILSGNSIDHALIALGAMQAGVPVAAISPAYSLMSGDFSRLRYVLDRLAPGLIYVEAVDPFAPALDSVYRDLHEVLCDVQIVASNPEQTGQDTRSDSPWIDRITPLADLVAATPGPDVERAFTEVGPESVAKILFTSGSTGMPKGVINTQRMLCSNQQAIAQCWPFVEDRPPMLVDWLPWSHTFGANHNFNLILRNGGTLYIDAGKPLPGAIAETVANLREVSPTIYFNVPRGFDVLLHFLENDNALCETFFARLDAIFYAGAALSQSSWQRLEALSLAVRGERTLMLSAWGATETAPMATMVYYPIERAGVIGTPAPGCEIKLAPSHDKLELRVRGPNVTPGYWRPRDDERLPVDRDGFLRMGDAGCLADRDRPEQGVVFDGRISENFKLSSGTWVDVGRLRVAVITAGAPAIQDAVITGHDRDEIGLLVFPSPAGCRSLCLDAGNETTLAELVRRPQVRRRVIAGLQAYNRDHPHSSTRVARLILLAEPPSIDSGEITDKGYINQRTVLTRRAAMVEQLYGDNTAGVLIVDPQ
ncbi:MAG: feruloyl-CoA synthase [Proteobacteria bacterium]|nr:feruloyl-CoA synthase [Pseudomonadota bacterium]